jgi:hypothetical protein
LLGELAALAAGVALALGEPEADEASVAVVEDALEIMALASLGEIVDVVALAEAVEEAEAEAVLLPEAELLPDPVRTIWPSMSD